MLRPADTIDVHSADGRFFAELNVRDVANVSGSKTGHSAVVHVRS
jgi:hypothetical protein